MSLRTVAGTGQQYHLISYDQHGVEVPEAGGASGSEQALTALADPASGITDVFILSHGWQGDFDDAVRQYDSWIGAANPDTASDGVRPFLIGLHWPSKAWSNRELAAGSGGLLGDGPADPSTVVTVDQAVEEYAAHLGGSDAVRDALRTVLAHAAGVDPAQEASPDDELPPEVDDAYRVLAGAAGADNGDDPLLGAGWDPGLAFTQATSADATGGGLLGDGFFSKLREAVLTPLRQLTFWHSKNQAREFGESGAATLVRAIMAVSHARVHLMGHSFGTVVMSGAVRGKGTVPQPPQRPVDSLYLVQGAVSLWAFADQVPGDVGGGRGYFADVVTPRFVRGPVLATRSQWDFAVGRFYPLAVGVVNQFLLGDLPKFGGIGTFGMQGIPGAVELPPLQLGTMPHPELVPGTVYNVDASAVIAARSGLEGAHNDLAHAELSHLGWGMALATIPHG